MPSETVLFDLHDVLVTSRRFSVGQRSFSLNSIRSIQFVEYGRSWRPAAASACLSAVAGVAAATTATLLAAPAAAFFVLASGLFVHGAPRYGILLHTEDGIFVPFVSRDRHVVEGVLKTVQSAAHRSGVSIQTHTGSAHSSRAEKRNSVLVPSAIKLRTSHREPGLAAAMPTSMRMMHRIHSV